MFYTNDAILEHIITMPSGYDRDKATYLYNRVNDSATAYCEAAATLDFTTMRLAADDGHQDVKRLLDAVDDSCRYDYDHIEYLLCSWVFDHFKHDEL